MSPVPQKKFLNLTYGSQEVITLESSCDACDFVNNDGELEAGPSTTSLRNVCQSLHGLKENPGKISFENLSTILFDENTRTCGNQTNY